jgi:hypothetical protein
VLARLAGVSLTTFSVDGTMVITHRLIMRVIRENMTPQPYKERFFEDVRNVLEWQLSRAEAGPAEDRWVIIANLHEQLKALAGHPLR